MWLSKNVAWVGRLCGSSLVGCHRSSKLSIKSLEVAWVQQVEGWLVEELRLLGRLRNSWSSSRSGSWRVEPVSSWRLSDWSSWLLVESLHLELLVVEGNKWSNSLLLWLLLRDGLNSWNSLSLRNNSWLLNCLHSWNRLSLRNSSWLLNSLNSWLLRLNSSKTLLQCKLRSGQLSGKRCGLGGGWSSDGGGECEAFKVVKHLQSQQDKNCNFQFIIRGAFLSYLE